ncbi:MAG TPA: hypothetical protein VFV33_12760, partial [Gemmatimonadaceae bacterium]|nr:hypothetical protein [Gemmatimonadaceae bacterium]
MRERPIDNCYPLPTGVGFGGQYPGDKDDEVAREKLGAILEAGVRAFIDLTEPAERTWGGAPMKPYD